MEVEVEAGGWSVKPLESSGLGVGGGAPDDEIGGSGFGFGELNREQEQ